MERKREEDSNFKFVIASQRRREGREGERDFLCGRVAKWPGRAGGDRVKTIQSQRGIGSDKERRRGMEGSEGGREGDKQINLQSEWGGLPCFPSSLLLYLSLPPSRDCARSGGAPCQKLFSAMALRSSPVAAKRGSGRNPRPLTPLPSFEVRNLSLRKC